MNGIQYFTHADLQHKTNCISLSLDNIHLSNKLNFCLYVIQYNITWDSVPQVPVKPGELRRDTLHVYITYTTVCDTDLQWFSNDNMTGYWVVMNAVSAIAWMTSYKHHIFGHLVLKILMFKDTNVQLYLIICWIL